MPPLLANLDASCLSIDTSLHIIYFTVDDLQRLHRGAFNGRGPVPESKQNALKKRLLENLELVFGLGKEDGLAEELSKDLVGSTRDSEATRARLIGRAVQVQAERDDRRVALAVSADLDTPWMTRCQRLVGELGFVELFNLSPTGVSADGVRDDDAVLVFGKGRSAMGAKRFECACCTDSFRPEEVLRAPCQHYYCRTCVTSLVKACTKDESLFPIKCCKKPITATSIRSHLENDDLRDVFALKVIEYNTPATRRVYCPKTRCSAFMGSLPISSTREMTCQKCHSQACGICRGPAHVGKDCPNDKGCLEVREMAKRQGWQTCPQCKAVIQKVYGCNSMVCTCKVNFCYGCGLRMAVCRGSCSRSGVY